MDPNLRQCKSMFHNGQRCQAACVEGDICCSYHQWDCENVNPLLPLYEVAWLQRQVVAAAATKPAKGD